MTRSTRRHQLLLAGVLAAGITSPAGTAHAGAECPPDSRAEVVLKVDRDGGHELGEIVERHPVELHRWMVRSKGIAVVRSTVATYCGNDQGAKKLGGKLGKDAAVRYAGPSDLSGLSDGRFHAWATEEPLSAGDDASVWQEQEAADGLRLAQARQRSTGHGTVVAVLDTGVTAAHPALADKLVPGFDYVDDDTEPEESRNGLDDDGDGALDESYGHGTFLAGIVTLVAPDAKIMPMRVLDSDGQGNTYVVAQAVDDAVAAGADVISLSLGTSVESVSDVLERALERAAKAGTANVAAAGNAGTDQKQYPAAEDPVLAVTALARDGSRLAAFSGSGGWVDVAAPGEDVTGPVPDGGYARWSGTSVATPFVAGQLALLRSQQPDRGVKKLTKSVIETARKVDPKGSPKTRAIDILASLDHS